MNVDKLDNVVLPLSQQGFSRREIFCVYSQTESAIADDRYLQNKIEDSPKHHDGDFH